MECYAEVFNETFDFVFLFLSQVAVGASQPEWRQEDNTAACRAFLEDYVDAFQEARLNPFGFAREFRAYLFPNESERFALALIAFTQGGASVYNGQWIQLFKINQEADRVFIFRAALNQGVNVISYFSRIAISDPRLMGLIISDFNRSKALIRDFVTLRHLFVDFDDAVVKFATDTDRSRFNDTVNKRLE